MAMVGHRTESIYRRYAIVDEMILRESAERLVAFYVGSHRRRRSSHCEDQPAENDTATNTAVNPSGTEAAF